MAFLNNIHIINFRVHRDTVIDNFNNFLALVGKNDVGKSSVLDALDFFFNGTSCLKDERKIKSKNVKVECQLGDSVVKRVIDKSNVVIPSIYYIRFKAEQHEDEDINLYTIDELQLVVDNQVERYLDKNPHISEKRFKSLRNQIEDLLSSFEYVIYLKDFLLPLFDNKKESLSEFLLNDFDYDLRVFKQYAEGKSNQDDLFISFKQFCKLFKASLNSYTGNFNIVSAKEFLVQHIGDKSIKDIVVNFQTIDDLNFAVKSKADIMSLFDSTIEVDVINQLFSELMTKWKKLLMGFGSTAIIPIGKRGSGVKRICSLFYHLLQSIMHTGCRQTKYIFAIDEPEISLHPEQQRILIDILKQVSDSFDNIQIIITSHSPVILDKLNDNEIFVLPQKDNRKVKRCIKVDHSINETIYIAFNEPSIAYHQELFGFIHNVLMERYEKDIDNFKNEWDTNYKRPNNGLEVGSISAVDLWLKHYGVNDNYFWYNVKKNGDIIDEPNRSLPYCVRNYIDHPLKKDRSKPNNDAHNRAFENNKKYAKLELIQKSIEIMRKFIIDNTNIFPDL